MKISHWGRVMGPVGLVLLVASILTIFVAGDTWLGLINIGLGLAFVAFYLASNFGELAAQAGTRGTFYTVTSAVSTAVLLAGLGAANYLAVRHPKTWDITANKIHTLSDDTLKTLQNLPEPVEAIAFFKTGEPGATQWEELFARYHAVGEKFTSRTVDPEKEPLLVKAAGLTRGGPHVVVKLGNFDVKVASPTEEELTNALVKVTHQTQKKVYFLDGHGEAAIDDKGPAGILQFIQRMSDEGLKAQKLPFGNGEIPADAAAVVIAGAQKPLLDAEVAILRKYLDQGGHVLVLAEPMTPTGLDPLLRDWGIAVDPGVVVDQVGRTKFESPFAAVGVDYGEGAAVKNFKLATVFAQAASLSLNPAAGVTAQPLVYTLGTVEGQAVSWVESGDAQGGAGSNRTKMGPLTLSAAASKAIKKDASGKRSDEGRLIVFGDHDFVTNGYFSVLGNGDLALNCINFLADQSDRIAIRPRQREASRLFLSAAQMGGIRFFATELPIALLAFGLAIFFNRRAK